MQIMLKQGLDMLKLFKNFSSKTSLLDDFMYYENRQKIMHDERARIFRRTNGHAHSIEAPLKFNSVLDHSQKLDDGGTWIEKVAQPSNSGGIKTVIRTTEVSSSGSAHVSDVANMVKESSERTGDVSTLKIGSLSIHPKPSERRLQAPATTITAETPKTTSTANVLTVGSMPIKVEETKQTSEILTIGTIALDPKALQHGKVTSFLKGGMRK